MTGNLITKNAARLAAYADRVKAERKKSAEAAALEALIRVHEDLCRRHSPFIMAQDYGYVADAIAQATGEPVRHQGQDCELCDGMGGYGITGSTAPAQVCPGCGGSGLRKPEPPRPDKPLRADAWSGCCPNCGSSDISGLMAAFWVPLTAAGEMQGEWGDYQASSELSGELMCNSCDQEFLER